MSGDLSDKFSWFLSPSPLSELCKPGSKNQLMTNLVSKKPTLTKVFQGNQEC